MRGKLNSGDHRSQCSCLSDVEALPTEFRGSHIVSYPNHDGGKVCFKLQITGRNGLLHGTASFLSLSSLLGNG